MPEIWLNYGKNEVVLDIMAENLDERIEFEKPIIDDSVINENLEALDLSKPTEIVIQNYSCLLYTSPSPRDRLLSRMPSSA